MKKPMVRGIICCLLVGLFFSFGINQALAGFGISPPSLKNDHLLPGSHYEQIISLVRGDPKETLPTKVKINAPEIEGWIKVEPGFEFDLPEGVQQFQVKFIVDVPSNAEFKLYQGTIDFSTLPKKEGQVTTALGAQAKIALRISAEQYSGFELRLIDLKDTEEGLPINLTLKIENRGNQEVGFDKAHLKIFDKYHSILLEEGESDISEKVEPFKIQELSVSFPTALQAGQYWGEIDFYKDGELIKKDAQVFYILEKTTPAETSTTVKSKGMMAQIGGFLGEKRIAFCIGLALIISIGLVFLSWRKKRIISFSKKEKIKPEPQKRYEPK